MSDNFFSIQKSYNIDFDNLLQTFKDGNYLKSISSGFENLNKVLGGGFRQGLYMFGAGTGKGKTTFALNIANNLSKQGCKVLYYSYELDNVLLYAKSLSVYAYNHLKQNKKAIKNYGVEYMNILRNTQPEISDGLKEIDSIRNNYKPEIYSNLAIINANKLSIKDIEEDIKNLRCDNENDNIIVFIDYLQKIRPTPTENDNSRRNEIDSILASLMNITKQYHITIFAISSLTKDYVAGNDFDLSAFKESGNILYDSDYVLGLYGDGYKQVRVLKARISERLTEYADFEYMGEYACFIDKGTSNKKNTNKKPKSNTKK